MSYHLASIAALVCGFIWLVGCDRAPQPHVSDRHLVVLATLYPLADLARQVGGDHVRVDWLLQLGDPIDHYELDRRDRDRLAGTDLVLCDGVNRTETWAAADLNRLRGSGGLVGVDTVPLAHESPGDGLLYLDPDVARQYVDALADAMTRGLPDQASEFHDRARAVNVQIETVAAAFHAPKGARVMVLSPAFVPMLTRLGVGVVEVDADPLHFVARDADAVRVKAKETGVRSLLVPFDTPPGTAAYLERQTGLKVTPIDALGYPTFDRHASYLDLLRYDLEQLRAATG